MPCARMRSASTGFDYILTLLLHAIHVSNSFGKRTTVRQSAHTSVFQIPTSAPRTPVKRRHIARSLLTPTEPPRKSHGWRGW